MKSGAGPSEQPRLQVDRLLEHLQRVLVDVLVPMVLVALQGQRRQLRQHDGGEAGIDEQGQPEPGVRRAHQLDQLVAHPLRGDDLDPLGHVAHRADHRVVDGEAELRREPGGPHHPQRVVGERVLRPARCLDHAVGEVDHAAVRVFEVSARHPHRHRVDGEVPAAQVAGERVAEVDDRLARGGVIGLGPVRRHLDHEVALAAADRPEVAPHVPVRVAPLLEDLLGLLGPGRRREVEVVVLPTEHRVAHRPTDQRQLVPSGFEQPAQLVDDRPDPVQLRTHGALHVGDLQRRQRGLGHDRAV